MPAEPSRIGFAELHKYVLALRRVRGHYFSGRRGGRSAYTQFLRAHPWNATSISSSRENAMPRPTVTATHPEPNNASSMSWLDNLFRGSPQPTTRPRRWSLINGTDAYNAGWEDYQNGRSGRFYRSWIAQPARPCSYRVARMRRSYRAGYAEAQSSGGGSIRNGRITW